MLQLLFHCCFSPERFLAASTSQSSALILFSCFIFENDKYSGECRGRALYILILIIIITIILHKQQQWFINSVIIIVVQLIYRVCIFVCLFLCVCVCCIRLKWPIRGFVCGGTTINPTWWTLWLACWIARCLWMPLSLRRAGRSKYTKSYCLLAAVTFK